MTVRAFIATVVLFALLAYSGIRGSSADESAIRQLAATLADAWNAHDLRLYSAQFLPEASFVNVNGRWWRGRSEIEQAHIRAHALIFGQSHEEITPKKIRFVTPELAVMQMTWRSTGDARNPAARDYLMTTVAKKQDGRWWFLAAQNGSAEDRSSSPLVSSVTPASLGTVNGEKAPDPTPEQDAVTKVLAQIDEAWNKNDSAAAARAYAPDADLVSMKAEWLQGRAAIQQYLAELCSKELKDSRSTSEIGKFTLVSANVAVVNSRWTLASANGIENPIHAMGLLVLVLKNGVWQITSAQNTIVRPGPTGNAAP